MLYDRQKTLLALLNALGGNVGILDFQKLLFVYCQEFQQTPSYEFVPYRYGGFSFTSYADKRRLSPLVLVRRATPLHREFFGPALKRLGKLARATQNQIVRRVPEDWMSELARTFAVELICYNLDRLKRITP